MHPRTLTRARTARPFAQPTHVARIAATSLLLLGLVFACNALAQAPADDLSPATIRKLQHSLMQGGYEVDSTDGVWGPKTAAALREFQRIKGLPATGRADAPTLSALGVTAGAAGPGAGRGEATAPPVRARSPADLDRETIRAVQRALAAQGLTVGAADGRWGDQTESAIGNFQRARGMPASGRLDAPTLAALGLLPGGAKPVDPARAAAGGNAPGAAGLDPAAIRMIQQALVGRGYAIGAPDGIWGERTVDALRDFQRTQGLEPQGEPDVHTLSALGLLPGRGPGPSSGRASR